MKLTQTIFGIFAVLALSINASTYETNCMQISGKNETAESPWSKGKSIVLTKQRDSNAKTGRESTSLNGPSRKCGRPGAMTRETMYVDGKMNMR